MCSTHFTLSGIILCVLPTSNSLVQFMFTKIPGESAWVVLCRQPWCWLLLWQLQYITTQLIWILDLWYPGTCYHLQKVVVHYCLFVFSVLYTKNGLKGAQFSRYIQPSDSFPEIWVITGVLVCPVYALHWFYCTEKQHKVSLFPSLFCLSFLCSELFRHGLCFSFAQVSLSLKTWTMTSSFLQNTDCPVVKWLVSNSRQVECPLLVLTLPQTLAFLSNSVSADLTILYKWLDRCDDSGPSFSLSDKTVSSKFCLSARCIFILQI